MQGRESLKSFMVNVRGDSVHSAAIRKSGRGSAPLYSSFDPNLLQANEILQLWTTGRMKASIC